MINIIWFLLCVICGLIGFIAGSKGKNPKTKEKPKNEPADEPTDEQRRKTERARIEYNNFLNYDGSEQEEIP